MIFKYIISILGTIAFAVLLGSQLTGCGKDENPVGTVEPPFTPANLVVRLVSASEIALRWDDNSSNEDGFRIEESTGDESSFTEIGTTGPDTAWFRSGGKITGTRYIYRVRAFNTAGNSSYSNLTEMTVPLILTVPGDLTGRIHSETELNLKWKDNSDDESNFEIEESVGDRLTFTLVAVTEANVDSLFLSNRMEEKTYYYRVRAVSDSGSSVYSNEVGITTAVPVAPRSLTARAIDSTSIRLNWTDMSNNEDSFNILDFSSNYPDTSRVVASTGKDTSEVVITGRKRREVYRFRVQAVNNIGSSSYSAEVSVTITPRAPENPNALVLSPSQIILTWSDMSDNEEAFNIEESVGNINNFLPVDVTGIGESFLTLTGRQSGTNYHYRLFASNDFGRSVFSTNAVASTPLWSRTYGGGSRDMGKSIKRTSDGGYVIVGYTSSNSAGEFDVLLIKTDGLGVEEWRRTYGEIGAEKGADVLPINDGYIIVGSTKSSGSGQWDVLLIGTDTDGNESWSRTYGGNETDLGYGIVPAQDGMYVILGSTRSWGAGEEDIWLFKISPDREVIWQQTIGDDELDVGNSIKATEDGGYIIAGSTQSFGRADQDMWLIKTDSDGVEQWSENFGVRDDFRDGFFVQRTFDGYIFSGSHLIKTNIAGEEQWEVQLAGVGKSVQVADDGGYIVVGSTGSYGVGGSDLLMTKIDASGSTLWTQRFGGNFRDWGEAIILSGGSGYSIMGSTESMGSGMSDVWLFNVPEMP